MIVKRERSWFAGKRTSFEEKTERKDSYLNGDSTKYSQFSQMTRITFDSAIPLVFSLPWLHAPAKGGDSRDARTVQRRPQWIWRGRGVAEARGGQPPCLDPWKEPHPALQLPPRVGRCLWLRVCNDRSRQDTSIRPSVAINDRKVANAFLNDIYRSRFPLSILCEHGVVNGTAFMGRDESI